MLSEKQLRLWPILPYRNQRPETSNNHPTSFRIQCLYEMVIHDLFFPATLCFHRRPIQATLSHFPDSVTFVSISEELKSQGDKYSQPPIATEKYSVVTCLRILFFDFNNQMVVLLM